MYTITASVAAKFVALDRLSDIDDFCTTFKIGTPGFLGLSTTPGSDSMEFNFDEGTILSGPATTALNAAIDAYYTPSLARLKNEKITQVETECSTRLFSYFPFDGYLWDCDLEHRSEITEANGVALVSNGTLPVGYTRHDHTGTYHAITATYLAQMTTALYNYTALCKANVKTHTDAINAMSNPTTIAAYNVTTGWPTQVAGESPALSSVSLPTNTVGVSIDGGGSVISTGIVGTPIRIEKTGTINHWSITADAVGDIVVDVWKLNDAVPTVANSITGAGVKPNLTAQQINNSGSFTNWVNLPVAVGDIIIFNVVSATTVTKATVTLNF